MDLRRADDRLLGERQFDLLVVDNLMPDLTGLDLIRDLNGVASARSSMNSVSATLSAAWISTVSANAVRTRGSFAPARGSPAAAR